MTGTIRFVGDLARLQVRPGDIFVLTCPTALSMADVALVKQQVRLVLGDAAKVLVLSDGMRLGVVAGAEPTP